jgi:hypothetical protein
VGKPIWQILVRKATASSLEPAKKLSFSNWSWKDKMEQALAEKSIFLPPLIVGALLAYRTFFLGLMTNHPILKPYLLVSSFLSFTFDKMTGLFAAPSKSLLVNQTSLTILNTFTNSMSLVVVSIQRMLTTVVRSVFKIQSTMILRVYSIVTNLTNALSEIRFRFHTVTHKTYNTSSNLFTALQGKVTEVQTFFFPPPKSIYLKVQLGAVLLGSFLVLAFTIYYLSKLRTKTVTLPEPVKVEDLPKSNTPVRRNPVRRKAKAA